MFENMLDHDGIASSQHRLPGRAEIGAFSRIDFYRPVDEFFDLRFGKLPYRSLQFKHETREWNGFSQRRRELPE